MALIPIHRRVTHFWPAFFGGVFLFCAFAAVVIITYIWSMPSETVEKDRAAARIQKLAALRADNEAKLNGYRWINKQKGTVQIPIDLAMELVLVDLKKKTPHATGVKVENPYPAGLQDAAAAAPAVSGSSSAATPAASPAPQAAQSPPPSNAAPAPKTTPQPAVRQPLWNWESPAPAGSPVLKQ